MITAYMAEQIQKCWSKSWEICQKILEEYRKEVLHYIYSKEREKLGY